MGRISAGITALTFKIGAKLLPVAIKLAKFAKIGKIGLAIGSAMTYAYLFTWQFALMIMILLFVHESGHIWAMKRCGLKTKGIYFIPFLGAAAVTDEMFKTRRDEAYIAIMGPIWGLVLSLIAAVIYIKTGNALFAAAAGWMAMVNLFNLLPINPLDGGRIMKSISFSINSNLGFAFMAIGIIASTILTLWAGIILFVILLMIASLEFIYEYYMRNENKIIERCIKRLDDLINNNPPDCIKNAAINIKNFLSDGKEDPSTRIKTIISLGANLDNDININNANTRKDIDYVSTRLLSRLLLPILYRYNPTPKMTAKGIVITSISYILVAVILWALMTYMNHIPEVEIARKFFMS